MPSPQRKKPIDVWEQLLLSPNLYDALWNIYSCDFLIPFAKRFNREPHPVELTKGVMKTARAYLEGKWLKEVERGKWLQYSGVHLVSAGLASRKLSYALAQLSKSSPAKHAILQKLNDNLKNGNRDHAAVAYDAALKRGGPATQLLMLQELTAALEDAIGDLILLPEEYDEEKKTKPAALAFVETANDDISQTLTLNYPVEEAARAFKSVWEEYSTLPYRRGRYKHEIAGYDCKAGDALHAIIHCLDLSVASSLTGTAIENIRTTL